LIQVGQKQLNRTNRKRKNIKCTRGIWAGNKNMGLKRVFKENCWATAGLICLDEVRADLLKNVGKQAFPVVEFGMVFLGILDLSGASTTRCIAKSR